MVEKARILLLTVPDQGTVRLTVAHARSLNSSISIMARALRTDDVAELRRAGADAVIQPEFEGGVEMVRQALVQHSGDPAAASHLISDLRAEYYRG